MEKIKDDCPVIVSIRCMVYNHEKYIRQCLEGFVMQKTNFRFEAIVHDDASTDGTAAIIKEYADKYPDIIKPIFETENLYSKRDGSMRKIMNEACSGRYFAICEGDDYWTDPYKLQKQIDYMESHPECGMSYTEFSIKNEITGKEYYDLFHTQPEKYPHEYTIEQWILKSGYVAPMTWVIRKTLYDARPQIASMDGSFVDFTFYLSQTKPHCFYEDNTATYRIISESASHSKSIKKLYNRACSIFKAKLLLTDIYVTEDRKAIVNRKICKHFYDENLNYAILSNDIEMVQEAKAFYGTSRLQSKMNALFFIAKYPFLKRIYRVVFMFFRSIFRRNSSIKL